MGLEGGSISVDYDPPCVGATRSLGAHDPYQPAILAVRRLYAFRVQAHQYERAHESLPRMERAVQCLHIDRVGALFAVTHHGGYPCFAGSRSLVLAYRDESLQDLRWRFALHADLHLHGSTVVV